MIPNMRLGVLGGGNMAEALVRGVIRAELLPPAHIAVHDILPARREVFAALGCAAAETPAEAAAAGVVLLATKPQNAEEALSGLAFGGDALLVSIAAGIPCKRLEGWVGGTPRVVRVMPNTPLLVGMGASALARGTHATAEDMARATALFAGSGVAVEVPEDALDAVTALSGSGPAYVFRFAEALQRAGEELGLDPGLAAKLTCATLRGSAEMLERFGDPAALGKNVTSPGGTTAAALAVLDAKGFDGIVSAALAAARDRGAELGRDA